jgi:hypothetical protein
VIGDRARITKQRNAQEKAALSALDEAIDPPIKEIRKPLTGALTGLSSEARLKGWCEKLYKSGSVPAPMRKWAQGQYAQIWTKHLASHFMDVCKEAESWMDLSGETSVAEELEEERGKEFPILMEATNSVAWRLARREALDREVAQSEAVELLILMAGMSREGVTQVVAAQASQEKLRKSLKYRSPYMINLQKAGIRRSVKEHVGKLLARRAYKTAEYEMARGHALAKRLAVVQAMKVGLITEVERIWVTEEDEEVCTKCAPLHRKAMAAKSWKTLYNSWAPQVNTPPAHINCRCVEIYKIISQAAA